MIALKPSETLLEGKLLLQDGHVVADQTCARIDALVERQLTMVARDTSGWDALYRDPADGRLWEKLFLQSSLHGGGPPTLRLISASAATEKYHIEANEAGIECAISP